MCARGWKSANARGLQNTARDEGLRIDTPRKKRPLWSLEPHHSGQSSSSYSCRQAIEFTFDLTSSFGQEQSWLESWRGSPIGGWAFPGARAQWAARKRREILRCAQDDVKNAGREIAFPGTALVRAELRRAACLLSECWEGWARSCDTERWRCERPGKAGARPFDSAPPNLRMNRAGARFTSSAPTVAAPRSGAGDHARQASLVEMLLVGGRGKPRLARLVGGHGGATKAAASRRTPRYAALGILGPQNVRGHWFAVKD